jgi:hypothetical protein
MSGIKLTREQYDALKAAQRRLLEMLPECDKLSGCGIQTDSERSVIQDQLSQIDGIFAAYADPPPR